MFKKPATKTLMQYYMRQADKTLAHTTNPDSVTLELHQERGIEILESLGDKEIIPEGTLKDQVIWLVARVWEHSSKLPD